jgi:uncharacterized cupredoxin-like copper-binding protein
VSPYHLKPLLAALALVAASTAALADTGDRTIAVDTMDLPGGHMALSSNVKTIPAGDITFVASNKSDKGRDHEVLMIKTDLEPKDLPKTPDDMAIDEHKIDGIIELGDMKPGESKETKIALEPGSYLLFCNLPGHTGSGMWTRLAVTEATADMAIMVPKAATQTTTEL